MYIRICVYSWKAHILADRPPPPATIRCCRSCPWSREFAVAHWLRCSVHWRNGRWRSRGHSRSEMNTSEMSLVFLVTRGSRSFQYNWNICLFTHPVTPEWSWLFWHHESIYRDIWANKILPDVRPLHSPVLVLVLALARCTPLWNKQVSSDCCCLRFSTDMNCSFCLCVHTAASDCHVAKNKSLSQRGPTSPCVRLNFRNSCRTSLCDCPSAGKKALRLCDWRYFGAFDLKTPCGLRGFGVKSSWSCSDWQSRGAVRLSGDSYEMRRSPATAVGMNGSGIA